MSSSGRPSLSRWWTGLGRAQRAVVVVVGVVIGVNLVIAAASSLLGGDPGGPVSSSFSTGGDGLAAYADLVADAGHPVVRLREPVGDEGVAPGSTVVLADPETISPADVAVLGRFVENGGRLVLAGETTAELLGVLTGEPVRWRSVADADRLTVWLPVDGTGSAHRLAGDDGGRWEQFGSLVAVAGADGRSALVVADVGDGRIVALADSAPLQNAQLARADNAAIALGAAGATDRPVVFVESVHGFSSTGLAAVPSSWKWTAAGVGLALLAGLWAAGTRFGPPERAVRTLRPPRRAHVDAVAATLERVTTVPAQAAAPLAARWRAQLCADLGIAPDAAPAVLHAAAERAGIDPGRVTMLVETPAGLDQALAVGALAAEREQIARRHHIRRQPPARPARRGRPAPDPSDPDASEEPTR